MKDFLGNELKIGDQVVCDESNNPPEVIAKNEMVISTTFPLKATLYEIIITEDNK